MTLKIHLDPLFALLHAHHDWCSAMIGLTALLDLSSWTWPEIRYTPVHKTGTPQRSLVKGHITQWDTRVTQVSKFASSTVPKDIEPGFQRTVARCSPQRSYDNITWQKIFWGGLLRLARYHTIQPRLESTPTNLHGRFTRDHSWCCMSYLHCASPAHPPPSRRTQNWYGLSNVSIVYFLNI